MSKGEKDEQYKSFDRGIGFDAGLDGLAGVGG
jgi:hypothetical protein